MRIILKQKISICNSNCLSIKIFSSKIKGNTFYFIK